MAHKWLSTFFENAFVRRVNRRIDIRIVRFWRSTWLVEMCFGSGCPDSSMSWENAEKSFLGTHSASKETMGGDYWAHSTSSVSMSTFVEPWWYCSMIHPNDRMPSSERSFRPSPSDRATDRISRSLAVPTG